MRHLPIFLLLVIPVTGLAIEIDGQTDFARRLAVNSSISARIDAIPVRPGQRVAAGDVVVNLVDTGLQIAVARARAEADALAPAEQRALDELEKARELYARDSLAAMELQRTEQDHTAANSRLKAAQARLDHALFLLSQSQIRSPIDGVVLEVSAFAGQYVNTRSGDPKLLTIVDAERMSVSGWLPYEMAKPELVGHSVSIRYGDQKFTGRVVEVGREVTVGDNSHPAVRLRAEFETRGKLAAGLTVRITLADE